MRHIEVVAAVICRDGKYFVTRRGYGEFKDYWEFPGGKVEVGESRADALKREIKEELDAEIIVGDYITTVDCDYPSFHLTMHCYMCTVSAGHLVLKEHEDAAWLDVKEMASLDMLPADKDIVRILSDRV